MKRIDSYLFFDSTASRVIAAIPDIGGFADRHGEAFCDIERDYYFSKEIDAVYELELDLSLTQKKYKNGKCLIELVRL